MALFDIIAGHEADRKGYLRYRQIDKEKLRRDFITSHPRIFEDPKGLVESGVDKPCVEAEKLGVADSKISEMKKILADGERSNNR